VLHVLNVVEQLGVLEADGQLRGEDLQPLLVLLGKRPAFLIQNLRYTDGLAVLIRNRNAQDGSGEVAGAFVEGRIEAQIGVRVGNVDGAAGSENGARDAG